ncbi:Putative inner membrane protein YbhQ [Izhakiella capsodis]|uniref:Inner membrane protein YbhQ n=1 Tax=Izhakiella capsodis TaxID=1367852 RepID=A0A1I4UH69_9GAMM|nr:YbhQ family protein [Izhakiella capsodis]SFM88053.1 Putative inner membrane protein YbhQ [Izhakiella capsodis]
MRWFNRVQIVTGQTCLHIVVHLALIAALIWGWKHHTLMQVSAGLLGLYGLIFACMLLTQRVASLRPFGDFFEDFTTTYYFGAAMLVLYQISRIVHNNLLLACLGIVVLAGPALFSLLAKDPHSQRRHR